MIVMKNSIRELRKEQNYRQKDLAFKLASILETTVDKLFEPDPTMLKKNCSAVYENSHVVKTPVKSDKYSKGGIQNVSK